MDNNKVIYLTNTDEVFHIFTSNKNKTIFIGKYVFNNICIPWMKDIIIMSVTQYKKILKMVRRNKIRVLPMIIGQNIISELVVKLDHYIDLYCLFKEGEVTQIIKNKLLDKPVNIDTEFNININNNIVTVSIDSFKFNNGHHYYGHIGKTTNIIVKNDFKSNIKVFENIKTFYEDIDVTLWNSVDTKKEVVCNPRDLKEYFQNYHSTPFFFTDSHFMLIKGVIFKISIAARNNKFSSKDLLIISLKSKVFFHHHCDNFILDEKIPREKIMFNSLNIVNLDTNFIKNPFYLNVNTFPNFMPYIGVPKSIPKVDFKTLMTKVENFQIKDSTIDVNNMSAFWDDKSEDQCPSWPVKTTVNEVSPQTVNAIPYSLTNGIPHPNDNGTQPTNNKPPLIDNEPMPAILLPELTFAEREPLHFDFAKLPKDNKYNYPDVSDYLSYSYNRDNSVNDTFDDLTDIDRFFA